MTRPFIERYLQAFDCQVLESTPGYIHTQLSVTADRDLCNRPFYWRYVEQLNLPHEPLQLCLTFDAEQAPTDRQSELIFAGSQRYQHFLRSAQQHGRFVTLYQTEPIYRSWSKITHPYASWLGVNYLISYTCDQKRDRISQLGINLNTGEIIESFYTQLKSLEWQSQIPAHCHLLPQKFTLAEAVGELEWYLEEQLKEEDHEWAEEAMNQLTAEQNQLDAYYPSIKLDDEVVAEKKQRQMELIRMYQPRIEIQVINAGFFHLDCANMN